MARLSSPHLFLSLALLTGEESKLPGFWWEWKIPELFRIGTILLKLLGSLGQRLILIPYFACELIFLDSPMAEVEAA